jgi:type I restriction enzyme, S subunit
MTKVLRLGEFAEVGAGNSAPQNEGLFKDGTLPFVRTSDVGAIHIGSIESSRDLLTPEGAKGLKLFPAGTILFPKSGASTFLNHRVILNIPTYVSSHLATIKANNGVALDRYIFYFLQTVDARDLCQDQAYPSLNRDQIAGIKVPLPSLDEQLKIVEKLDNAFAEIDLLEENLGYRISATEKLQESLLASFFDLDEDEVTKDYSFHSLGSVSLVKGGKRLPKGTKWSPTPTKYPYIRVTDMKLGGINEDNLVFVPDEIRPLIKNYTVNAGDVIISIAGTIGEIAVVPESLDKASLTENAAKIILQKEKLDSAYCSYFLRSPVCRREIDSLVRTTTQPKLALFRIESLRIPIPPIKRQHEIVNTLQNGFSEIELLRLRFKVEKDLTVSLRQSFLSRAFTSEEAVA